MAKQRESGIKAQARQWFALHAQEYGNLTDAAENCAWELGHDEWLDDSDHWVWELAIEYMPEQNPAPYELRHYVVQLKASGEPLRQHKIGKRWWTPDWTEAKMTAAELQARRPRAAGFEVVSAPYYPKGQKNPARCVSCSGELDDPDPTAMLCLACRLDHLRDDPILQYRDDYLSDRGLSYKRALQADISRTRRLRADQLKTASRKNPGRATRWPSPVTKIVELIWALVEAHPDPDLAELNPVTVEHGGGDDDWTIGFDENVILYGWNDGYSYFPKKRTWRVYLGDTGKRHINWTTAQVEARVRQLLSL